MTIKEFAEAHGVSPQAVYKKLTTAGVKVSTLKDSKTGHLTPDGETLLNNLYSMVEGKVNAGVEELTTSKERINQLETELTELKAENVKLNTLVETLTSERDFLRGALEHAQQLHAMALTKMLPPAPAERKGLFGRLFGRKKEGEHNEQ